MDARWPEVSHLRAILAVAVATLIATTTLALASPATAPAATYPPGFSEQTVFSGLTNPTAIRFSSDGRVFVAESRRGPTPCLAPAARFSLLGTGRKPRRSDQVVPSSGPPPPSVPQPLWAGLVAPIPALASHS